MNIDDIYIMYLTHIYDIFSNADTFFPNFDSEMFNKSLLLDGMEQQIPFKQYKYVRR